MKYFHPITNLMDRGIVRQYPYTRSRMHSIDTRERRRRIIKAASAVMGDPRDHDHSVKKCQNYLAHKVLFHNVFIHLKIVLWCLFIWIDISKLHCLLIFIFFTASMLHNFMSLTVLVKEVIGHQSTRDGSFRFGLATPSCNC